MKNMRHLFLFSAIILAASAQAQDTYDAYNFSTSDLNGTARYVGMGGALGALGGDLTVMGTNPAATAMYRKNDAAFTLSEVVGGNKGAFNHDRSRFSFDQAGVVVPFNMENPDTEGIQYINFGVNYRKNKNFLFNQNTNVDNLNLVYDYPDGNGYFTELSQTYQIAGLANSCVNYNSWGSLADLSAPMYDDDGNLTQNGCIIDMYDKNGDVFYHGVSAQDAYYQKATYGSNVQADINLSFNSSDRFFFGLSLGVYDISYDRESYYWEFGVDNRAYDIKSTYRTTAEGYDFKAGFIFRPIEDSPFRVGVTVHTPIWYRMTDSNYADGMYYYDYNEATGNFDSRSAMGQISNSEYDYNFRTPWKFGVSLGHTIGKKIAIGAEYEYTDLSTAKYSSIDGDDDYFFTQTNSFTQDMLKGQHTVKAGLEVKPLDWLSVRCGYNYVSSGFKDTAYRSLPYDGAYTETDFTNWKGINRFTGGVGFRFKGGYFDLAYQYQSQKGDFYAFDNYDEKDPIFTLKPTSISNNRSQFIATLGFRF